MLVFAALLGCRPAAADVAAESAGTPEGRGTAMPESLRCRQATDCVQRPSCYWEAPTCVASAAMSDAEKCGDDADPSDNDHPKISCDCFEGQCVPR